MSYFSNFSTLLYDPKGDGSAKLTTNILKRVRVRTNMKKEIVMLDTYAVKENETPEIVADKHHGSTYYHWVVLLVNNISDVYHGWPKSTRQMQGYLTDKYTEAQLNEVHHYEIPQTSGDTSITIQVPQGTDGATSISNITYELELNESKRSIDLLRNNYLSAFIDEFESAMG